MNLATSPIDELTTANMIAAVREHFEPLRGQAISTDWRCLHVTYEHPHVFRLWRQVGDKRLFLHRLAPVPSGSSALWHPHPWPSANLIVSGGYEMQVAETDREWHPGGWMEGMGEPRDSLLTAMLRASSFYTMTNEDAWHVVRPLEPTYSVMVVGRPYPRPVDVQKPTHAGERLELGDPRVRRFIDEWLRAWTVIELIDVADRHRPRTP